MSFEEIRKTLIDGHLYRNGSDMGRIDIEISDSARIKKLTSEFGDFMSLVEQMRKAQKECSESIGLTASPETERLELGVDSFIDGWNKRMAENGKEYKGEMNYDN